MQWSNKHSGAPASPVRFLRHSAPLAAHVSTSISPVRSAYKILQVPSCFAARPQIAIQDLKSPGAFGKRFVCSGPASCRWLQLAAGRGFALRASERSGCPRIGVARYRTGGSRRHMPRPSLRQPCRGCLAETSDGSYRTRTTPPWTTGESILVVCARPRGSWFCERGERPLVLVMVMGLSDPSRDFMTI